MIVSQRLYDSFAFDEGRLTDLRSAIICNTSLSQVCIFLKSKNFSFFFLLSRIPGLPVWSSERLRRSARHFELESAGRRSGDDEQGSLFAVV